MQNKSLLTTAIVFLFSFPQITEKCFGDANDLFQKADDYIKVKNYQQAETVYKDIVQKYPGTDDALTANSRLAVLYISQKKNSQADAIANNMVKDFLNNSKLSESLYIIARRYAGAQKYAEAKGLYRRIIDRDPNSEYAVKSAIGAAKIDIFVLIENNDDTKAKTAIDKLAADFSGNPDAAAALYYIAEKYVKRTKYEMANSLYQRIIEQYPNSQYAGKAKSNIANNNAKLPETAGANDLFQKADNYVKTKNYQQAETAYKDIIQQYSGKDGALAANSKLAALYFSQKRFNDVDTIVNNMINDFWNNSKLSEELYVIARKYSGAHKYAEAKWLYQHVVARDPNNGYAIKSAIDMDRVDIFVSIENGNDPKAKAAIDKLITDFPGNPFIATELYTIAGKYAFYKNYEQANSYYQRIIEQYPDSQYASKAKYDIAKNNAILLVGDSNSTATDSAVNRLVADFSGNSDLAKTLKVIAEQYQVKGKYAQAQKIYQQQSKLFPDNPAVNKIDIPRINIMCLIDTGKIDEAGTELNKLIADFKGSVDLPKALYEIAGVYEKNRKYSETLNAYKHIISLAGESSIYGRRAKLGIDKINIIMLINSGQDDKVITAVNEMIIDFVGSKELPPAIFATGETYCNKPYKDAAEEKENITKGIAFVDMVVKGYPSSGQAPQACCYIGDCYNRIGDYANSITYYQKSVDGYPGYRSNWHALFMIGRNYETMLKASLIPIDEANSKIKAVYQQLIEKYPAAPAAKPAQKWLSKQNSKK